MSTEPKISARGAQILDSIVRAYIESGDPIASQQISKLRRHNLSAASVRGIMAELMADGFLQQPHTSAGRIPTSKAFQVYVQGLQSKRVQSSEVGRIRGELNDAGTVEEQVERSSHMLTEMTQSVGITAAIPTARQTLDHVELISLGGRRVLMIVVTRDHLVRRSPVSLDEPIAQEALDSIRNYINAHFSGWVISNVEHELRRRLEQASAAYDEILKHLTHLYAKGLLAIESEPEVRMEGAANLLGFQFHVTRERLREILQALDEKKRILQLLERFLDQQTPGEIGVQVGLGDAHPSLDDLSLIGLNIQLSSGLSARLAVLGPMRMDYERAVSAVLHVGRAFSSLPS
jgi:heat-inducible transcriptional repressor